MTTQSPEEIQADYEQKAENLEKAIREMQEAWALLNGNTPGSLVTEWQLSTSARNINEDGDSISQVMILGSGAAETIMGITRLAFKYWESDTINSYGWHR